MTQETRRALVRALAADARPPRPRLQRRRLGPVEDDTDAILHMARKQVLASPFGYVWRRADTEFRRHSAIAVAQRSQPRVWPPPPGPSAFQLACMARDRRDRAECAAARWLQRRTPGSALWGTIVLPPGDTRVGSMTLTVNRCRRIDRGTARPRQRRAHRTAARPTVSGDSGDEPPEPPGRHHLTSEVVPC